MLLYLSVLLRFETKERRRDLPKRKKQGFFLERRQHGANKQKGVPRRGLEMSGKEVGVVTIATNGIILSVDVTACKLFGYRDSSELLGNNVSILVAPPYKVCRRFVINELGANLLFFFLFLSGSGAARHLPSQLQHDWREADNGAQQTSRGATPRRDNFSYCSLCQ